MTQSKEHEESGASTAGEGKDMRQTEADQQLDGVDVAFLEPQIQEQLGRVLRSFCDDLIRQPIPDKFVVLLAQLEAKQRETK